MNSGKNIHEMGVNDYIRKSIDRCYHYNGIYHQVDSFDVIADSFDEANETDTVLCQSISSILFLDTYKMLSYKVKKGVADDYELIDYNDLSSITSFEELKDYYQKDISRLLTGFINTNSFINLPALTKIGIVKGLSKEENCRLNSVTSFHQNDIDKYGIDVDKDYIYSFYRKYNTYLNEKRNLSNIRPIVVIIANYIKDNYFLSPTETKDLIKSITDDVFSHITELSKLIPSDITTYDTLAKEYQNNDDRFTKLCLRDQDIMELILGSYFLMKDIKIIKGKTYDKK